MTQTAGQMLKSKLVNFAAWLQQHQIIIDADISTMPETVLVAAVQDSLLEHKEHVHGRDLDALLTAVRSHAVTVQHLNQAILQFEKANLSVAEQDKFWRYLELFIMLVE